MKKRSMHRIHIGETVWKWYLNGQRGNIVIFDPVRKRYELTPGNYLKFMGVPGGPETGIDQMVEDMAYTVVPADIKRFIIDKLVGS